MNVERERELEANRELKQNSIIRLNFGIEEWYKTHMDVPVFSTSPDPTCMYQTPALKAALSKIRLAVARKQGLSCIFGDVGMGKSSLLRYLLAGYMADENNVISFLPSGDTTSPFAFLKRISADFGVAPQRSRLAQMDAIEEFLTEKHATGMTTIMMIDEAQLLSLDCLESIRSLLNYETNTEKMTQVILSGQLDLRDRMMSKRYRAFRSRIVAPVVMEPLTAEETEAMIAYRLDYWQAPNLFTSEACRRVYELTGGIPRIILLTCQYAYDVAGERKLKRISPEIVDHGFGELSLADRRSVPEQITTLAAVE
jgi:general secretion pathway protein A